jgi:hypothetical protein
MNKSTDFTDRDRWPGDIGVRGGVLVEADVWRGVVDERNGMMNMLDASSSSPSSSERDGCCSTPDAPDPPDDGLLARLDSWNTSGPPPSDADAADTRSGDPFFPFVRMVMFFFGGGGDDDDDDDDDG